MRWLYKLSLRFRSLFRKGRVEQELSDELRFHLGKLTEEYVAKGMTPEEARYAALRELGGMEQIREECRDMRRVNHIENFIRDFRYALRMLARSPGFTAVAVIMIALGIGVNAGIFTILNAAAFRPLPVANSGQLVSIYQTFRGNFSRNVYGAQVYSLTPNTGSIAIKIRFSQACLPTGIPLGQRLAECSLSNFRGPSPPAITLQCWRLALNWAAAL